MKINSGIIILISLIIVLISGAVSCSSSNDIPGLNNYVTEDRAPNMRPDYTGIVIPPNIAPLNFIIEETGIQYYVKIQSPGSKSIDISSKSPKIIIPMKPWKNLLGENRGKNIDIDTYVKKPDGSWIRFKRVTNTVANENIDGHLVYRLINSLHNLYININIYQRNLENYDQSLVLSNNSFENGCVNCHTFLNNSPDNMFVHIRAKSGNKMILVKDGIAKGIDSRTNMGGAPMSYSSWHPTGKIIAFSSNKVRQFFHRYREEVRDVIDLDSGMGIYYVDSNTISTPPQLTNPDRMETLPTWSPDGKYLYFCSAPILWEDRNKLVPERYKEVKYELMRVSYDIDADTWGIVETVLSTKETGLTITFPRISPDGKFLLFCMAEYGCFTIFQPSTDLYMMDMNTGEYERLKINSKETDSWHSWSSNSKWFVFSTKRLDGVHARPHFCYVNEKGEPSKPVLLPQKDPAFYDSLNKTYNLPELITKPVKVTGRKLAAEVYSDKKINGVDITTAATEIPGDQPWMSPGDARLR
ncbi:MAG TPA: cytochrome C biosynthesis protein [bacterium]|nr:cytochrome C biosynthesis protein [bacterium]